jgi:Enoyl-(Acyl carrier protein) reductase
MSRTLEMTTVLITNVRHYTGAGALPVLLRETMHPLCHDSSFEDETMALSFEKANPGATALRAQTSEAYYPRARFIDDPEGRRQIQAKVPMGRLGDLEEVGELAAFLVSGRSTFMTGQVINFTGAWP